MFKRLMGGLSRWLEDAPSEEKRRAPRVLEPSVVVYYWDGSVPESRKIRDISHSGAYIITPERWYVGTIVRLILQGYKTTDAPEQGIVSSRSLSLPCRVVRHGEDGIGVEFMFPTPEEKTLLEEFLATCPSTREPVTMQVPAVRGQALIEFALIMPLIFLLIVNAVNFGSFLFAWITIANAARAGAQYRVLGSASAGTSTTPTAAQVTTLVSNDIASLTNRASLSVQVCTNTNGTVSCGAPPADPEPADYVLASVDVSYTYRPLIPLWEFPGLGIHATLPTTTIHRQVNMRVLQ